MVMFQASAVITFIDARLTHHLPLRVGESFWCGLRSLLFPFSLGWVFVAACRLLIVVASLRGTGFRSHQYAGSVTVATGSVDLRHVESSEPGIEPASPALAGRFLTPREVPAPGILDSFLAVCYDRMAQTIFLSCSVPGTSHVFREPLFLLNDS